ncbi:MAG: hypothetical protein U5K77_03135 [Candidatus Saccharibacteria bacterium]|nr:hypothetical protein [Candidatus Saccharibacteria bacterium]
MPKSLELTRRVSLLLAAGVLALVALLPAFGIGQVGAEQLTSRSATIDKSYPEATDVEYVFEFDIPTGGGTAVQSIRLQWCTQPLGTCVAPTDSGTAFDASGFTVDAQSFTETGTFASNGGIDENDCTAATNSTYEVCLTRTQTTPEDVGTKSITLSGINHPDDEQTIYVRINLYSGEDFATADHQHYGVVAAAIVQQITVTARVQERLVFCVGTETSAGSAAATDDCAEVSGTTQDLGAVDFLAVCVTLSNPCETNNPSDTTGSFALVATNAQEGAGVTYYAEQDTTGGASDHLGSCYVFLAQIVKTNQLNHRLTSVSIVLAGMMESPVLTHQLI